MDKIYNQYYSLADIGGGSFARILKVKHCELEYVRALKVLNKPVFSEEDKIYQTFRNECKTLLKICNGNHPNIVRIYKPERINQSAVVEMDYINGDTLEKYMETTIFMQIDEVYKFIRQIGSALAYCHEDIYLDQMDWTEDNLEPDPADARKPLIDDAKRRALINKYSVVHNDLHDANVMRRHYDGNFILLDFGLAIQNGKAVKSSSRRDGAIEYKSPEKWENLEVETPQNDIYSFGVLMYKVLTGQETFPVDKADKESRPEKAAADMMEMHLHAAPPAIEPKRKAAFKAKYPGAQWKRDYPEWLDAMVMKCLEKDPKDRYVNARELLDEFNKNMADLESSHGSSDKLKDLNEKLATMEKSLSDTRNELSRLQTECTRLQTELKTAKAGNSGSVRPVSNKEIAAANERANKAEQEKNVLSAQVQELSKKLSAVSSVPIPEPPTPPSPPFFKMLLWAILGVALGIFLGIVCYNLFVDYNNGNASEATTEMVEAAPID